jgi:hypothetical protein
MDATTTALIMPFCCTFCTDEAWIIYKKRWQVGGCQGEIDGELKLLLLSVCVHAIVLRLN